MNQIFNIQTLPKEILCSCLKNLNYKDLLNCRAVCKLWNSKFFWKFVAKVKTLEPKPHKIKWHEFAQDCSPEDLRIKDFFSHNGKIYGVHYRSILVWDQHYSLYPHSSELSFAEKKEFLTIHRRPITCFQLARHQADRVEFITGCKDGRLVVSEIKDEKLIYNQSTQAYSTPVKILRYRKATNFELLITSSGDNSIHIWKRKTGKFQLSETLNATLPITSLDIHHNHILNNWNIFIGHIDGTLSKQPYTHNGSYVISEIKGHTIKIEKVQFCFLSKSLISQSKNELKIWDTNLNLKQLITIDKTISYFIKNQNHLIVSANDGSIILYENEGENNYKKIAESSASKQSIIKLVSDSHSYNYEAHDESRFLSLATDNTIKIWYTLKNSIISVQTLNKPEIKQKHIV